MRIYELLLEYRRDVTQQKLAKELSSIADNENTTPEDVLEQVENMDPTKNKQFVLWLVKQLSKRQFRLEDAPRVTELLTNFISVKNRLPVEQRDIGRFDFYKLDDLIDKTMNVELEQDTATSNGTFPVVPGSKVLYNGPLGQLAIPETEAASCELGRGTKWCTAAEKDNMFDQYSQKGPLYVWRDKNGEKYQFHFGTTQFMDSKDRPIDSDTIAYFRTRHPVLSKMFTRGEAKIISGGDSSAASSYADAVIGGRWPEAEPTIMADAFAAAGYAHTVIGGRWPEAEKVIATDAYAAVNYAIFSLQDRWPAAEKTIASNPTTAVRYASTVIKRRWPAAEPTIMTDVSAAVVYAQAVIGGRWPQAEPNIKTDKTAWRRYTRSFPDAKAKRVPKTAAKTVPKPTP
jgi:hypothetical protein